MTSQISNEPVFPTSEPDAPTTNTGSTDLDHSPEPIGFTNSFADANFSSGSAKDEYVTDAIAPVPDRYQVKYDVETTPDGVVSLTSVSSDIESTQCGASGQVRIRMKIGVWDSSLSQNYPVGAVLAIDSELSPDCVLKNATVNRTRFAGKLGLRDETVCLRIQIVPGSLTHYTIKVKRSSFSQLFKRAIIVIRRVNTTRTNIVSSVRQSNSSDAKSEEPEAKVDPVKIDFSARKVTFGGSYGNFKLETALQFMNHSRFSCRYGVR